MGNCINGQASRYIEPIARKAKTIAAAIACCAPGHPFKGWLVDIGLVFNWLRGVNVCNGIARRISKIQPRSQRVKPPKLSAATCIPLP
jgi:hypothetical protein